MIGGSGLRGSYNNLALEGIELARSLGGRSDASDIGGSGVVMTSGLD